MNDVPAVPGSGGRGGDNRLIRRWMRNALGVIAILLLLLELIFAGMLRYYYYQSVQNALEARAELYQRTLELSASPESLPWAARSRELIAYFTDKDKMELQVLDARGAVLLSSTGFVPIKETQLPDFRRAGESDTRQGVWRGRNGTGESVMALTVLETDDSAAAVGGLRFVVSLSPVNRQILILSGLMLAFILLILVFVSLSGSYFISSIVRPVTAIGRTARRIAMGEYGVRLTKHYDDEIGDLCDTINFMAGEIGETEKMKNEFISSVSHELRTPLTAIKGWSETLQEMPEDRELTARGLAVIGKEAERLSGLVEELLDFSRVESGRMTLRQEPLDVAAVLEEAVFLFRDRASRVGISLEYCESTGLPTVTGDGDRLQQVFVNLLDNAIKYSRPGARVRVEAAATEDGAEVAVSDTGIGIPADQIHRIRRKFYQVDPNSPGSGIGLAMADEIIRLHGGRMDIESEEGVGTTVTVRLPASGTGTDRAGKEW